MTLFYTRCQPVHAHLIISPSFVFCPLSIFLSLCFLMLYPIFVVHIGVYILTFTIFGPSPNIHMATFLPIASKNIHLNDKQTVSYRNALQAKSQSHLSKRAGDQEI